MKRTSLKTPELHEAFLRPFDKQAVAVNELSSKPLLVDMRLPLPPRLRLYMYNLVGGIGTKRAFEYKAVMRLRDHPVGEYRSFDHSGDRLALLVAYQADLDVFVRVLAAILLTQCAEARFARGVRTSERSATCRARSNPAASA